MQPRQSVSDDPLGDLDTYSDAHPGAVLLSDQIEFYIKNLDPPLLENPSRSGIEDIELEDCLDTASYKLRLGDEAHVGGTWVQVSRDQPLVLSPHQVAIVKTHEVVNIPRFLIARWNLRVQWVYEGLLWVGGPQVDPGWQGELYCPIYNLAEREIVIKYLDRVFTMDFTRTTPVHENNASYGFRTKTHEYARPKSLQGHDIHRLRSGPFEALSTLATLDTRVNSFISLTFLALAVMIGAIGVVASLSGGGAAIIQDQIENDKGLFALMAVALVFGFSGLLVSSLAMAARIGHQPRARGKLTLMALFGTICIAAGTGYAVELITSGPPDWWNAFRVLLAAATVVVILIGVALMSWVWLSATRSAPIRVDAQFGLHLSVRPFGLRIGSRGFSAGRIDNSEDA